MTKETQVFIALILLVLGASAVFYLMNGEKTDESTQTASGFNFDVNANLGGGSGSGSQSQNSSTCTAQTRQIQGVIDSTTGRFKAIRR